MVCSLPRGHKRCALLQVKRLTIGQNCSTVCINEGGHRDAFSNERHEVLGISRGQATEPQAKREARSVLYHTLVVDSMFEQNNNVAITSSSCSWPAVRGMVYAIIA